MSVGHGGLYHSQSPEGYFMGASGLKVCLHLYSTTGGTPLNPIIFLLDCHPALTNSIEGSTPRIYSRPEPRHFHGAKDLVPFCRYVLFKQYDTPNH